MKPLQLKFITIFAAATLLAGCSSGHRAVRPARPAQEVSRAQAPAASVEVPHKMVRGNWEPRDVKLTCPTKNCPAAVGVLLFAEVAAENFVPLKRCTAFLINADTIVSNGHCDFTASDAGFFVVRGAGGNGLEVRRIRGLLNKVFTINERDPTKTSGRPDVAVFSLEQPVEKITPLSFNLKEFSGTTLTAYVINDRPGAKEFTLDYVIDERVCAAHRHEAYFPIEMNERPDVITAFDCEIIEGNSGSPMLGSSGKVEAIVQAGLGLGAVTYAFENHRSVAATNPRCLEFLNGPLSAPCVVADEAEFDRRFAETQLRAYRELDELPLVEAASFETGFTAHPYRLVMGSDFDRHFEVTYLPSCRRQPEVTRILIPARHVEITYDEWARPVRTDLGLVTSVTTIVPLQEGWVELRPTWVAAPGVFLNPKLDPRVQWGNSFSVALPFCAG